MKEVKTFFISIPITGILKLQCFLAGTHHFFLFVLVNNLESNSVLVIFESVFGRGRNGRRGVERLMDEFRVGCLFGWNDFWRDEIR